jgi:hypothetical protein
MNIKNNGIVLRKMNIIVCLVEVGYYFSLAFHMKFESINFVQ